jgi:uncharacterized membrane protein YdcZ (DUF606 family)
MNKTIILALLISLTVGSIVIVPIIMIYDKVPMWVNLVSMAWGIFSGVFGAISSVKIRYK